MSNTEFLYNNLKMSKTVYLYDDFEEMVFNLIPQIDRTKAFAKFKGKEEYELSQSTKLVFEATMGGKIVDKEFYDNY